MKRYALIALAETRFRLGGPFPGRRGPNGGLPYADDDNSRAQDLGAT